jgi:predicted RNA-binding Zn-ribbon protein involved in translation (DUF1610 family)
MAVETIDGEVIGESTAVATRSENGLAMSFSALATRVRQLDQFYRDVMQDGTDYGTIPGTGKPSLFQPGAQLLDQIFGLTPTFEVMATSIIDWQRLIPFFHYVVRCQLKRGDHVVAEGVGSCNSWEDKYRWRKARKACPSCGQESIGRSKAEYGGGYFCNKKNGGCGASFKANTDGARKLDAQAEGRIENEDTASIENTVLKMAQKRAHIAATLNATGASRIFTQDVEDLPPSALGEDDDRPAPARLDPTDHTRNTTAVAGTRDVSGVARTSSSGPATTVRNGNGNSSDEPPADWDDPETEQLPTTRPNPPADAPPFGWAFGRVTPEQIKQAAQAKCSAKRGEGDDAWQCDKTIVAADKYDFAGTSFNGSNLLLRSVTDFGHTLCPVHYKEYRDWAATQKGAA